MPAIDPYKVSESIKEVAAQYIEPRFEQLETHEIKTKSGPTDLVTIADEEAERALTQILKDLLPGSYVVGEEAVAQQEMDPSILQDADATIWVVDPVDGTNNFANGTPIFGTMIGLVHKGEVTHSWIYNIPEQIMAAGEKGAGSYVDGQKIILTPNQKDLTDMRGFVSHKFLPKALQPYIKEHLDTLKSHKAHFCCAYEYVELLTGAGDFALYSRINPWDHLPGTFLVEEAGGYVRKWNGSVYETGDDFGGLLVASDEPLWTRLHDQFLKKFIEEKDLSS